MVDTPKVFQIGLNKTATRSIFVLFKRSGYPSLHWHKGELARNIVRAKANNDTPLKDYSDTILFTDMECVHTKNVLLEGYKEFEYLEKFYPNAKFILNSRDVDGWLRSRMLHREGKYFRYFTHHYNTTDPIEIMQRWKANWIAHHVAVREYFADKPGKLLEFELGKDDGGKIVNFFSPDIKLDIKHWDNITAKIRKQKSKS